jgi:hypothetical protein
MRMTHAVVRGLSGFEERLPTPFSLAPLPEHHCHVPMPFFFSLFPTKTNVPCSVRTVITNKNLECPGFLPVFFRFSLPVFLMTAQSECPKGGQTPLEAPKSVSFFRQAEASTRGLTSFWAAISKKTARAEYRLMRCILIDAGDADNGSSSLQTIASEQVNSVPYASRLAVLISRYFVQDSA